MKCVPTLNWLVAQVKMVRVPVFATDHRADEHEENRWEPTRQKMNCVDHPTSKQQLAIVDKMKVYATQGTTVALFANGLLVVSSYTELVYSRKRPLFQTIKSVKNALKTILSLK